MTVDGWRVSNETSPMLTGHFRPKACFEAGPHLSVPMNPDCDCDGLPERRSSDSGRNADSVLIYGYRHSRSGARIVSSVLTVDPA